MPEERISVGPARQLSLQTKTVLLLRADYVLDERLVRALMTAEDAVLVEQHQAVAACVRREQVNDTIQFLCRDGSAEALAQTIGLRCLQAIDFVPAYSVALRKADPPYVFRVDAQHVSEIEAHIFAASYKGITDFVTKFVWPRPASIVVHWLANAGMRPNPITLVSWGLVLVTTWLFARGHFGVGLVTAWLMTFLDTVDGKLARVTLTSSRLGHVLDHGLDLLHPPFWYLAWAIGLYGDAAWWNVATLIVLSGYVVGRLIEGIFLLAFKMEIHCWRPIDAFFRTITARRNPNLCLLMLGTMIGRPDLGLMLVAGWTVLSIGFHTARLTQAFAHRWRGQEVGIWQEFPSEAVSDALLSPQADQSESLA
jgi:phosphatidylglycerophosphate synthase